MTVMNVPNLFVQIVRMIMNGIMQNKHMTITWMRLHMAWTCDDVLYVVISFTRTICQTIQSNVCRNLKHDGLLNGITNENLFIFFFHVDEKVIPGCTLVKYTMDGEIT